MYQVKVLSDQEFDALPYPEMETSLGVADPETSTAYVRYTGLDAVDKYLVSHELEHLIDGHGGIHSDHYRNGLYYKGFGEILQSVISPVVGMFNPVAGAGLGLGGSLFGKKPKQQEMSGGGDAPNVVQTPSSAMDSFKPSAPNIVTPGGNAGMMGGGSASGGTIGQMKGGGSPIERVRGFFSSRNPQGGF